MKSTKLPDGDLANSVNTAIPPEERKVNIVAIANLEKSPAHRMRELIPITIKSRETVIKFCSRDPVEAICAILRTMGGS